MKTKVFLITALASGIADVCSAQMPSPTATLSNWQLAPPFETRPTPTTPASSTPTQTVSVRPTPAPTTAPQLPPAEMTRGRKNTSAPYVEGPVWVMTFVKTKSGLTDDYLKSITGSLKPVYDEEKRQKIILDYKILSGGGAGDRDFNIIIMVEYPNMAALDGLRDKTEPIIEKIIGPTDERRDMAAKRLDIREILATKTMREITLR